jgi:hypothetical protein
VQTGLQVTSTEASSHNLGQATVTQLTSITTGVTCNGNSGVVTTVALTTSANTLAGTFTVNNSAVTSTSVIVAHIQNYSGTYLTNGMPFVAVNNVTSGSFDIVVMNTGSSSLNGILKISFIVA